MSKTSEVSRPWFGSRTYDFLKFVAQILLPALGTLYFALAEIWGLPKAAEVVGTIVAVDTFLGVILGISSAQYIASESRFDGSFQIQPYDDGRKVVQLELNDDPDKILKKSEVSLRVKTLEEVPISSTPGDLPSVPPATH